MDHGENGPDVDPALDRMLSELLAQAAQEPVSARLRELAGQLEVALEQARRRRRSRESAGPLQGGDHAGTSPAG